MTKDADTSPLDEALAVFIQHQVTINVATRDAGHITALTRAVGCRVSVNRRKVSVFLAADSCQVLLNNLHANGAIAMVVIRPSTHACIQIKGDDAVIGPLEEGDHALLAAQIESLVIDIKNVGFFERFARTISPALSGNIVAATFTPLAVFHQTPGPGAGRRLYG